MSARNFARQLLLGSSLPQEYLCVEESLEDPFSIFVTGVRGEFCPEVSRHHIFLGYRPLIMAVVFDRASAEAAWMEQQGRVCLSFVQRGFVVNDHWLGFATDHASVARLMMKKINALELGDQRVFFFQGEAGEHTFLSGFYKLTNRLKEALKKRPAGNVDLPGNLFDQVVTAYSMPRKISLITAWNGSKMNLFPTDLHGQAGKYYLGSLRMGGKANEQVEETGTIAMSRIDTSACRYAYEAGKNHMSGWNSPDLFELLGARSGSGIPLPLAALSYLELRRAGSVDIGIHRVHYYEIVEERELVNGVGLAHIHRYYAQWRLDHQMPAKLFFRSA